MSELRSEGEATVIVQAFDDSGGKGVIVARDDAEMVSAIRAMLDLGFAHVRVSAARGPQEKKACCFCLMGGPGFEALNCGCQCHAAKCKRRCFRCSGDGWVSNGDIEDGMMTGRDTCHICKGDGVVTAEQVVAEIARILALAVPVA